MTSLKPFPLYTTFTAKIPKNGPTKPQQAKMTEMITTLTIDQKIAMCRLIIEHARLHENLYADMMEQHTSNIDQCGNVCVPYNGAIIDENNVKFDLNQMPNELKWILYKFLLVCKES